MENKILYDNRIIVKNYIGHKLLKKGYVWELHEGGNNASSDNGLTDSSPFDSQVFARWSRAGGPGEDNPVTPPKTFFLQPNPHAKLHTVLREAVDEIERLYQRDFADMTSRLQISSSTTQRSFRAVIDELFRDGVNWGRILAFFEFGGTLCVQSVNQEMTSQVDNIACWMTEYLNGPLLHTWIRENGGWEAFMELYGQRKGSLTPLWPGLKMAFGLVALGAAGITIGAFFIHK